MESNNSSFKVYTFYYLIHYSSGLESVKKKKKYLLKGECVPHAVKEENLILFKYLFLFPFVLIKILSDWSLYLLDFFVWECELKSGLLFTFLLRV